MSDSPWLLALGVALLLMPLWRGLWRLWSNSRRERRIERTPAHDWQVNLERHCGLYLRMPPGARGLTVRMARQFVLEKCFVGCNGLAITPLMQQLVAFNACALIHARGLPLYDELQSVLIYPAEFIVQEEHVDAAGVVSHSESVLSGQSIEGARIVLAWPDVQAAGRHDDGYNVVVHEFAHHLDHALDGALSAPDRKARWRAPLESAYQDLCRAVDAGHDTLIDPYGSEDPVEFFAVASEAFMELAVELAAQHPPLYAALREIYGFDPAAWAPHAAVDSALRQRHTPQQ